ncbi:hypothetical protein J2X69_003385 [Algoriphagus sp. 4150]|nr:hypothetical protein [Algoriphagus sp. 4150]MDR7131026.1 hypothetical protein [Algoriphagus sp. 4150]
MNIKKPEEKIAAVVTAIKKWKEFAEEARVDSELRDGIASTLLV